MQFFNFLSFFVFKRNILVLMESAVSGHQYLQIRERLADKLETIKFDPFSKCTFSHKKSIILTKLLLFCLISVQQLSVYRERRKIKSIR